MIPRTQVTKGNMVSKIYIYMKKEKLLVKREDLWAKVAVKTKERPTSKEGKRT